MQRIASNDPFIELLISGLPEPNSEWPIEYRAHWLEQAVNLFAVVYPASFDDRGKRITVTVKIKENG